MIINKSLSLIYYPCNCKRSNILLTTQKTKKPTKSLFLGDPTYVKDLNMSYRESNVFKFADKIGVRFLCEIKLCLKIENGCDGITPPICGNNDRGSFQDDKPADDWQIDSNTTVAEGEEYNNYVCFNSKF